LQGTLVHLAPLGFLEGFELLLNIVNFVINVFEIIVVNRKTVPFVVDGFVELLEDILDFFSHILALC